MEIADLLSMNLSEEMQQFVLELEERLTFDTYHKEIVLENIDLIKKKLDSVSETETKEEILSVDEFETQVDLLKKIISKKRKD